MPISGSSSRSIASRCSALRPCRPNTSRSPRTSLSCPVPMTRPSAEPRSEWMTRLVLTGRSCTSAARQRLGRRRAAPSARWTSVDLGHARSSRSRRRARRGTPRRRGRSMPPSRAAGGLSRRPRHPGRRCARFSATARMRESLSPSCRPEGSTDMLEWFSSTRSDPPFSPTAIGKSRRSCCTRSSSRLRSACRAKYPISGSLRLASSSVTTTTGSTTACSANRKIAFGSLSSTEVSST